MATVDGSLLSADWELDNPRCGSQPDLRVDHLTDPGMIGRPFIELKPTPECVRGMFEMGQESARARRNELLAVASR